MRVIKIAVLIVGLSVATKYAPNIPKMGFIMIKMPLMICWSLFSLLILFPNLKGVRWGTLEWWKSIDKYKPDSAYEKAKFVVLYLFFLSFFCGLFFPYLRGHEPLIGLISSEEISIFLSYFGF